MATETHTPKIISTVPEMKAFIASIPSSCTLYMDLEGHNLGRYGTLNLITILIHPQGELALIDVFTLKNEAFTTASDDGKTLKTVLEDPNIAKGLWDVRNDSDALWSHYEVNLGGVIDIQLFENASRGGDITWLYGLDTCVRLDLDLDTTELHRWTGTKWEVRRLMDDDIFSVRPFGAQIVDYCINDVLYLPKLHDIYLERLQGVRPDWLPRIMRESERRVVSSQYSNYKPSSRWKAVGPWGRYVGGLSSDEDEDEE